MPNLVKQFLKVKGPSLSTDISEHLVRELNITSAAARQRVSREGKELLRLDRFFPRNAKFLYLQEQAGSFNYWQNLEQALLKTNSAIGNAISAIREREGIIPLKHFEIVCGSPIKQKKHIPANVILKQLQDANLIKTINIEGVGECVYLGIHEYHIESLIPSMKARLIAEDIILKGLSDWMRKMGFISYKQVATRAAKHNPIVSTTAWDLAGPSYLAPLTTYDKEKVKSGFIVCDLLLNREVGLKALAPYLQKLASLRSLKRVGKTMPFFLANTYSKEAFKKLKALGISPVTVDTLFGKDIGRGLLELISLLSFVANLAISTEQIDKIFNSLGKIEGAANRLRGAFFEYIIADILRDMYPANITVNKTCKSSIGTKEADVVAMSPRTTTFVEGKGYNPVAEVSLDEVKYWLHQQVPVFRRYAIEHSDIDEQNLTFEFWTTGVFSDEAREFLEQAKASTQKYKIDYKSKEQVLKVVEENCSTGLIKTYKEHFALTPLTKLEAELTT